MASKCRKFVPNMFNKTKCQSCFGSKEQHSAEALESNKASRKVSKCGYLFVAPGYDFSNPLDKTKRWQRRFFILYDDGELAYSVDENPDTVPQGVVDMNKCTDVKDASGSTSHSNSMAIITPEKTTYIKGNSKEEIQWWFNILIKFPENNVVVPKPKFLSDSSNKENISPEHTKEPNSSYSEKIEIPPPPPANNNNSRKNSIGRRDSNGLPANFAPSPAKVRRESPPANFVTQPANGRKDIGPANFVPAGTNGRKDTMPPANFAQSSATTRKETVALASNLAMAYYRRDSSSSSSSTNSSASTSSRENKNVRRTSSTESSAELDVADSLISPKSDSSESSSASGESKGRFEVEKVKGKDGVGAGFTTYRGVRSMKHGRENKHHADGLRKSSSLHDLSTEDKEHGGLDKARFLSRSGDRLDSATDDHIDMYASDSARLLSGYGNNPYATLPRDQNWKSPVSADRQLQAATATQDSSSNSSIGSAPSQASGGDEMRPRRGSFDDKQASKPRNASERARMHRERSASMKSFPTGLTLPKIPVAVGSSSMDRLLPRRDSGSAANENETDEHKMAKSSELQAGSRPSGQPPPSPTRPQIGGAGTKFEDLMYMKKGWLIKMGTSEKDWKKHWFVLTGNSLRYYKDAKAEETNSLDGRIDLSGCYEIAEVQIQRNYGFKIKTRNGEYTLSAMTSGIRSNWMKAIRLCMDLQSTTKPGQAKPLDLPAPSSNQRPTDDMDVAASSQPGPTADTGARPAEKKDFVSRRNNVRRHYSDVNPGNISRMFSIKGLGLDKSLGSKPGATSSSSSSALSSKEPSVERDEQAANVHKDTGAVSKHGKYEPYWSAEGATGIPFRRFVEGSDNEGPPVSSTNETAADKQDEEERKRRAKSPSAKIKDRSRAKSPRLLSPPPGQAQESKYSFRPAGRQEEADKMSVGSDEMDYIDDVDDQYQLEPDDPLTPSTGDGMLVDLLENEVESLKERLEHTQQELAKSHDSNRDLKTKLQTVVREKDPAQLQASVDSSYTAAAAAALSTSAVAADSQQLSSMKRQVKEAKDTIHRQKTEIDQVKSKLDMSVSKLTGTEKALSEALKDVKKEKDKFFKLSTEYNRKVKDLEGQLKDVTQKMEKYHENSLIKDKENRKLDLELKQHQQRVRDNDREILKLKAVEHEYRQTKEKFDETEKYISRLRNELKEKDSQYKKLEIEYEEQFENLMQEFTKERDDTEHHIEELKTQLLETQRKNDSMSDQVSSNVADLIREKDEIIAQLEEKVIESETKMVEVTEELKANEDENAALQQNMEIVEEERDNSIAKIKDLEKALSFHQTQMQRMEKENASIRKHMDDLRKENTDLSERLDCEKSDVTSLAEDNDSLKNNVKDLEQEVHSLHEKLTEVLDHEKGVHPPSEGSGEMSQFTDSVLSLRKQVDSILSGTGGDQKSQLKEVAEKLEDLCRKCDSLNNGSVKTSEEIVQQKSTTLESKAGPKQKTDEKQISEEIAKKEKLLEDMQKKYSDISKENDKLKERMSQKDSQYQDQVEVLSKKVDDIASKYNVKVDDKKKPVRPKKVNRNDPAYMAEVVDEQLVQLEEKVEKVERIMETHDLSTSGGEPVSHIETEEETDSDSDDSDDFLDSEDETDTESDTQDDSAAIEISDDLLGKLREMKLQLEHTNLKVKELMNEIHDLEQNKQSPESKAEEEMRHSLIKCGEKVNEITSRMSEGLKYARTETPRFSDQTWAFQKCVGKLKEKVTEVSIMAHEHDDLNHKDLKVLQAKMQYLVAYVNEVDKVGESDWDAAGKIAKQELKFQHLLAHKEKATRKSTLKYEDRLQLYADKLAFEAMILGQMGILIQRQQVGIVYKDVLLREIHDANLSILDLERRIDTTTREMNSTEEEKDLVSSYAAMLAEKVVLEGQLASCAMVQDVENDDNLEVLQALNVNESPTVLAMEIFLRSQLDSSVNEQLEKFSDSMNKVSNHIVTRALLQGEISHALKVVKKKFKPCSELEDLSSLVKRERQFAFEQLEMRHMNILDLLNETEPTVMTTLIQLIEYTQGPNPPTLDSVCATITSIVSDKVKQLEKQQETADANTKTKLANIIAHLHSELEDAIVIFREEYHCYVQTASPDINPNVLKFSVDSVCEDLAGMFIQKAVINGSYDFIVSLQKKTPEVQVSKLMDPMVSEESEGLSDLARCLGQIMLTEAANKQSLANEVRHMPPDKASSIKDLVSVIPEVEAYPQSFDAYTATLVREAMFQSQLTYTTYKLKLQYHRELREIKLKFEAGEKVVLPSDVSREAESDIQVALTTFEEILNTKYQDECAVLAELEKEIGRLKSVSSDKSCAKCKSFDSNLKQLEKTFQHEVSVAKERQDVHIDVLRQEIKNVILRVDKFLEDTEREKEKLVEDYEDRVATLQDEFELMRVDHEEELEQVKQDIMTAVSAIKATEGAEAGGANGGGDGAGAGIDTVKQHNRQLAKLVAMAKEVLSDVKSGPGGDGSQAQVSERITGLMCQITQLEEDPSLSVEFSLPPPLPDSPSSPPSANNTADISFKLDRTLSAEPSDDTVDKLLERSQHEHEMEQLKREKEAALADEIKVTKAALDAMRKAYEEELDTEKEKFRTALKTMFTEDYVEDIRRRHEIDEAKLREDLSQISMHYESKCEDYKLMEDRLARTKAEYQAHINQLQKSNEHLTERVSNEIEELKNFIQTRTKGTVTGNATLQEELYDSQIMVRVKDAELQKLRSQVKNLENSLERITEEQRYTMTQYLTSVKKVQELQGKLKEEVMMNKDRRDSAQHEEQQAKAARALRRNPSFHQRARSPSPEVSPRKDNTEHHSRDSHRRSRGHLSAKDLKRSQSSPSLPFVFEAKSGLGRGSSSGGGQAAASQGSRRDSAKYSAKSPKK